MFWFRSEKRKMAFFSLFLTLFHLHCWCHCHHYYFIALCHYAWDFLNISSLLRVYRRTWMCISSLTPPFTLMLPFCNTRNCSTTSTRMSCVWFWPSIEIINTHPFSFFHLLRSCIYLIYLRIKTFYLFFAKFNNLNNGIQKSNSKAWYW